MNSTFFQCVLLQRLCCKPATLGIVAGFGTGQAIKLDQPFVVSAKHQEHGVGTTLGGKARA